MADSMVAADETARAALPDTAIREPMELQPDTFHRWVNRRWPRREPAVGETAEA